MKQMKRLNANRSERGAALVEYALLASLIALAVIVAVRALGVRVAAIFQAITAAI